MVSRREFLRLSCAAAVATSGGILRASALSPDWLSIGFADESGIVDAWGLYGGDARFLRDGARISVTATRADLNFSMNALCPVEIDGTARLLPFSVASKSSVPVRFVIPVDPDDGVAFEVVADAGERRILRFTVNPREGAIPLRRGTYIVAVSDRRAAPEWRSLDLIEDRGFPVLESHLDGRALTFAPLFLAFDTEQLSMDKNKLIPHFRRSGARRDVSSRA